MRTGSSPAASSTKAAARTMSAFDRGCPCRPVRLTRRGVVCTVLTRGSPCWRIDQRETPTSRENHGAHPCSVRLACARAQASLLRAARNCSGHAKSRQHDRRTDKPPFVHPTLPSLRWIERSRPARGRAMHRPRREVSDGVGLAPRRNPSGALLAGHYFVIFFAPSQETETWQ
jgi:hypothetical protein